MKNLALIMIATFGVVNLSACSKAESPKAKEIAPAAKVQTTEVQVAETEEDHAHEFDGGVKAYHDIMSPDWHMDAGDERTASTCNNVDEYLLKAMALANEHAPKGIDTSAWKDATGGLLEANKTLNWTCANNDKEKFAADFTIVHDKFHVLKELIEA